MLTIGINRAVDVLASAAAKGKRGASGAGLLKSLGEHPEGGKISVYKGRYGPYVKYGKINATLPKDAEPESFTLEQAVELIAAKAGKSGGMPAKRRKRA